MRFRERGVGRVCVDVMTPIVSFLRIAETRVPNRETRKTLRSHSSFRLAAEHAAWTREIKPTILESREPARTSGFFVSPRDFAGERPVRGHIHRAVERTTEAWSSASTSSRRHRSEEDPVLSVDRQEAQVRARIRGPTKDALFARRIWRGEIRAGRPIRRTARTSTANAGSRWFAVDVVIRSYTRDILAAPGSFGVSVARRRRRRARRFGVTTRDRRCSRRKGPIRRLARSARASPPSPPTSLPGAC